MMGRLRSGRRSPPVPDLEISFEVGDLLLLRHQGHDQGHDDDEDHDCADPESPQIEAAPGVTAILPLDGGDLPDEVDVVAAGMIHGVTSNRHSTYDRKDTPLYRVKPLLRGRL
jgi:hypothetical protein